MSCQSSIWLVQYIFSHLGTISLIIAVASGVAHLAYYLVKGLAPTLNATLAKIAAGFVLPPAVAMAGSAFDPDDLLGCVTNLELYILVGSVSVMWITWTVLFPRSIERPPETGSANKQTERQ